MRKIIFFMLGALCLAACSSIDCPLNSRVYATYKFGTDGTTLTDTLTVSTLMSQAEGNDSVLLNRVVGVDSISLPMSYARPEDVFYFRFNTTNDTVLCDTIVVAKQDNPHFEAVDCNPVIFHTITEVRYTQNVIESIDINNNTVTYNVEKAHFIIHLKDSVD